MRWLALVLTASVLSLGCTQKQTRPDSQAEQPPAEAQPEEQEEHEGHEADGVAEGEEREVLTPKGPAVRVVLEPTEGNEVEGWVMFIPVEGGVLVQAEVHGLTPGPHGFHVHENGDCSAPDASSAGGHFNPTGHPHGAPTDAERHVGDLGNLVADESGHAQLEWLDPVLALEGENENSIIGRAVIVHAGEDDLRSQPTGDAGGRVACGVIEAAQ